LHTPLTYNVAHTYTNVFAFWVMEAREREEGAARTLPREDAIARIIIFTHNNSTRFCRMQLNLKEKKASVENNNAVL
jgi:hypothetical protein